MLIFLRVGELFEISLRSAPCIMISNRTITPTASRSCEPPATQTREGIDQGPCDPSRRLEEKLPRTNGNYLSPDDWDFAIHREENNNRLVVIYQSLPHADLHHMFNLCTFVSYCPSKVLSVTSAAVSRMNANDSSA